MIALWFLSLQGEASDVGRNPHRMWKPSPFVEVGEVATYAFWARCDAPISREDADICQQWRMAVAAEKSAEYARLSYSVVGLLSLAILAAAAFFAQRAATWAKAAAISGNEMARQTKFSTDAASAAAMAGVRSADIAEKALRGLERPYLFSIIEGEFEALFFDADHLNFSKRSSVRPNIKVAFANYGRLPARMLAMSLDFKHLTNISDELRHIPNHECDPNQILRFDDRSTERELSLGYELDDAALTSIASGKSFLWAYGKVTYESLLGEVFETEFCWYYNGLAKKFSSYHLYNRRT